MANARGNFRDDTVFFIPQQCSYSTLKHLCLKQQITGMKLDFYSPTPSFSLFLFSFSLFFLLPPFFLFPYINVSEECTKCGLFSNVLYVDRFCGCHTFSDFVQTFGVPRYCSRYGGAAEDRQEFGARKLAAVYKDIDGSHAKNLQAAQI